jgi:hypothetical protein
MCYISNMEAKEKEYNLLSEIVKNQIVSTKSKNWKQRFFYWINSPEFDTRKKGLFLVVILIAIIFRIFVAISCDTAILNNNLDLQISSENLNHTQITGIGLKTGIKDINCENQFLKSIVNFNFISFTDLLTVHIGIGAIIFALFIFIAESMREGSMLRARILIKESSIFSLVVSEILSLISLAFLEFFNIAAFVLVFSVAIFAIYSLCNVIRFFHDKSYYKKTRISYCHELLKGILDDTVIEKVGNNYLYKNSKKYGLEFNQYYFANDENYYFYSSQKQGIITEINLLQLKELSDKIKSNYLFETKDLKSDKNDDFTQAIRLIKGYRDDVSSEKNNQYLIGIKKEVVRKLKPPTVLEIGKAINKQGKIFTIGNGENTKELWKEIFAEFKDLSILAIRDHRLGELEDLANVYISILERFIEEIGKKFGKGYDFKSAIQERNSLIGSWGIIQGLRDDAIELSNQAFKESDIDVIDTIVYFPIQIGKIAMEKKEHYVFQTFIELSEVLYHASVREVNIEVKNHLKDRSWRYLNEIVEYYITPKLRDSNTTNEEHNEYIEFSTYILVIFQKMMKSSYDDKEISYFSRYIKVVINFFDLLDLNNLDYEIINEEASLSFDLSETNKNEVSKKLEKLKVLNELKNRRLTMLFGLYAHIFSKWQENKDDTICDFIEVVDSIFMAQSIKTLSEIFIQAYSEETNSIWGWRWWDSIPDGKVRTFGLDSKIEKLYVFLCLKKLSFISIKQAEEEFTKALDITNNRVFFHLSEEGKGLSSLARSMKNNLLEYEPFIKRHEFPELDLFIKFLKTTRENIELQDRKKLLSAPISESKKSDFKNHFIKHFNEQATMLKLLESFGKYEIKTNEKNNTQKRFGIKTLDKKEVFIDKSRVSYLNWGEVYGEDMAKGKNEQIFEALSKKCKNIEINRIEELMKGIEVNKEFIIITTNDVFYEMFEDVKGNFIPKWQMEASDKIDNKDFRGVYAFKGLKIPVFSIFTKYPSKKVLLVDQSKITRYIQYSPLKRVKTKKINQVYSISQLSH